MRRNSSLFRPTNRRIRIFVGLLLAVLLAIQVAQSIAQRESDARTNVEVVKGLTVETKNPDLLDQIQDLAGRDHVKLLELCQKQNHDRLAGSYTCTFVKQERLRGKVGDEQYMTVQFMPKPFSVTMQWTKNPPLGDALVYIEGQRKDDDGRSQMLVRPASAFLRRLKPSVLRLPDGPDAMKSTLRPVTEFGFANSLQALIDVYKLAAKRGEVREEFGYKDEESGQMIKFAKVDGRDCIVLARYIDKQRDDYPAAKTVTFIDAEYLLPVKVMGWDWDGEFICNYEFRDLAFQASLTADNFAPSAVGIEE